MNNKRGTQGNITGTEKYMLWWILDYFFEKDKTDKSGITIGKAFAVGAIAVLIILSAFAATTAAQYVEEPDWENTFIYDQGDPNPPSELTRHVIGENLPIKVIGYNREIELRVIDILGNQIGTPIVCKISANTKVCLYSIPQVSPGEYIIQLRTIKPGYPHMAWAEVDTFQLSHTLQELKAPTVRAVYTYTEETVMTNLGKVQCTRIYHWTGDNAELEAKYIDYYYSDTHSDTQAQWERDGYCQEEEFKKYMKEVYEKPIKESGVTENIQIDGIKGNIIDVDCDYGRWRGYGAIEEDITITCTDTIMWNLEDKNEHIYTRIGLDDDGVVSFTVPEGWTIDSVEDLKGSSISSDKRTVSGLAISDEAYVIKFTKVPTHTPSQSQTHSPTPHPSLTSTPSATHTQTVTLTQTPAPMPPTHEESVQGFEVLFAIAGLLVVAYLMRRRK